MVDRLLECGVSSERIDVLKLNRKLKYRYFSFQPIRLYHDVENYGLRIIYEKEKAIYITDTKTIEGIVAKDYDLYLIEGNYDEEEIQERIRQKEEAGEFINEYRTMERHLSIEEATDFLLKNMGNKGTYEFIHQHRDRRKKTEELSI